MKKAKNQVAVMFVLLMGSTIAFAESPLSQKMLADLSDALAYDLGKAYQMGQNCNRELQSISPAKAAGLFINYFNEQEVQTIINYYSNGMQSQKSKACDSKELQAYMIALMEKLSNYIKVATPYTRPYTER